LRRTVVAVELIESSWRSTKYNGFEDDKMFSSMGAGRNEKWFVSCRNFKCSGEDLYREKLIPSKLTKAEARSSEEAKKISVPKLG
jgi:hypothetical protein